jgi:arginine/lysine/histidine/glutamine transport system ATP-binding protein
MTTTTPVIVSEGLRKSYGSLEVLKGVTGTLYQGDVVSVIGPLGLRQKYLFTLSQSFGNN